MELTNEEKFNALLRKGEPPYDYGRTLVRRYTPNLISFFNGGGTMPQEIEVQPSAKCNAGCSHCWGKKFNPLEDRMTTKENIDIIAEKILDFKRKGFPLPKIKFCGTTGEPLMNPLIGYFIDRFYGEREIRMFTNGIAIGERKTDEEFLLHLSRLNSIYLSLDAGTTQTLWDVKPGAMARRVGVEDILEGTRKIKQIGSTDIDVSYVITEKNYQEIEEATKRAKDYGMDLIRFRIDLTEKGRELSKERGTEINQCLARAKSYENEHFKVIPIHSESEISETEQSHFGSKGLGLKCYTNLFWTCIGPDGGVYPCGHIVSPETMNYGNLFEKSSPEIWDGEQRREAIKNLPGKSCSLCCSPFSLSTNIIVGYLLSQGGEEAKRLISEAVK